MESIDRKRAILAFADAEKANGTGGVMLIKDESYAYLQPDDPRFPEAFSQQLIAAMESDESKSMFFIEERDSKLSVFSINKLVAAAELA